MQRTNLNGVNFSSSASKIYAKCVSLAALMGTCISCLWWWAGWPSLFCGPTQEPALATAKTGKTWDWFLAKNEGEWTGKVEISKEEIPGSWLSVNTVQVPLDVMQGCSVMQFEANPHYDKSTAIAIVLPHSGIREAFGCTPPNLNSSITEP